MDSKYCQYLYKNLKKSVVGLGGMDIHNEYTYQIYKMKIYNWLRIRTRDPCITSKVLYHRAVSKPINTHGPSRPNYHIPPLTKFLPSKKHTSLCQDLLI